MQLTHIQGSSSVAFLHFQDSKAITPLLRDGLVLIQDVRRHVVPGLSWLGEALSTARDSQRRRGLGKSWSGAGTHTHTHTRTQGSQHTGHGKPPSIEGCKFWPHSCCFMDRIFGQMSPPLMDGWTSEMSFRPYEAKSCWRKEHQLPRSCDSHTLSTAPSYVVGLFK